MVSSEQLPVLRFVSLLSPPPAGMFEQDGWRPTLLHEVISAGYRVSDDELDKQQATVIPSDPALIMYTSGTTGFPKGAILSHRSLINQALLVMRRAQLYEDDRFCVPVPFFHIYGNGLILGTLGTGVTLYPLLTFDALKAMKVISQECCTRAAFVPTMLLAILQHPKFSEYDLTSLRIISNAGAPVPVALMEQVSDLIGADIGIAYGLTESAGPITASRPEDPFKKDD